LTASNTSLSWEEPEPVNVDSAAVVAEVDVAVWQAREVQAEEHRRQAEPRLKSRQPLQPNAGIILRLLQHHRPLERTTTRNSSFTLFRTEVIAMVRGLSPRTGFLQDLQLPSYRRVCSRGL
jgi:hypothetical protein